MILFLLLVSMLTGQRRVLLRLVFALVFIPFGANIFPLCPSLLFFYPLYKNHITWMFFSSFCFFKNIYTVLVCPSSICKPILSTLFLLLPFLWDYFSQRGGKEESWKKRREGPEKSPKITVMQVDRQ